MACLAAFGIWLINPYLGLLVAIGLQAWLAAAARLAGGQLAAAGLVLVGLLPLAALLADLAGRFDAGLSVWQDLVLMFADGQIGFALVLIGCVLAGAGVAIVAVAGNRPTPSEPGFRGAHPGSPSPSRSRASRRGRSRYGASRATPNRRSSQRSLRPSLSPPSPSGIHASGRSRAGRSPRPRQSNRDALTLGDVADLGQGRAAGGGGGLPGFGEPLGRNRDEQLVVLAPEAASSSAGPSPPAIAVTPAATGTRPASISRRQPLARAT